jgi:prepilin-type N-terminal cleavage/methylation domain-containing protein
MKNMFNFKGQGVENKGFSLLELLIVILIVGVLATLFLPNFKYARESALNDEARANLRLIHGAEKIYRMQYGFYFPWDADNFTDNITAINQYLKLSLPDPPDADRKWNYNITGAYRQFYANAGRNVSTSTGYYRFWRLNVFGGDPSIPATVQGDKENPDCVATPFENIKVCR